MSKKLFLFLLISYYTFASLYAISPTQDQYSDEQNFNLRISEVCSNLKENFFEFVMSSFNNDKSDSITTYTVTSSFRFLGGVTVLKLSPTDYVFIPILPSSEAANPMWAVDLFNLISEYTKIRNFLIPSDFFKSLSFRSYAEGYLDIVSSPSDDWVIVTSKPCDISSYTIKNINEELNTSVKLGLIESILTDAKTSITLKLKTLYELDIDYDRYYLTFVDKRSDFFGSSDLKFEDISLFDYLEASTYLRGEILDSIDSSANVFTAQNQTIYPISSFYVDLIQNDLVSSYDVYKMLYNRFFIEPPSIAFNEKHEMGLDVLNEVFFELPEDLATEFKNAFILLNGPSLSIITLDTIPIYLKHLTSFKKFTTENLYKYTDSLDQESIYSYFSEATDSFTASKLKGFFDPRHSTLRIILHNPDPVSMIWVVSTFEAIARVAHFNPLDIYNIVTVLDLLESKKIPPFLETQAVSMVEILDATITKLTSKYSDSTRIIPLSLQKLVNRLERFKKHIVSSASNEQPSCGKIFIVGR